MSLFDTERQLREEMLARLDWMYATVEKAMNGAEISVEDGVHLLMKIDDRRAELTGIDAHPVRVTG